MITEARARELRNVIENAMASVDDAVAMSAPELFPHFDPNGHSYVTGDKFTDGGTVYKVLQNHTSQPDWTPENAPSLYARVLIPTDENGVQTEIPVWEHPDSTNPYMTGDKVHFPTADDPVYESKIDNNVWSPSDYPSGWNRLE